MKTVVTLVHSLACEAPLRKEFVDIDFLQEKKIRGMTKRSKVMYQTASYSALNLLAIGQHFR